jgi:hypothetical protein
MRNDISGLFYMINAYECSVLYPRMRAIAGFALCVGGNLGVARINSTVYKPWSERRWRVNSQLLWLSWHISCAKFGYPTRYGVESTVEGI